MGQLVAHLIILTVGIVIGVVYEKKIKKYKDAAVRAAKAAESELHKG